MPRGESCCTINAYEAKLRSPCFSLEHCHHNRDRHHGNHRARIYRRSAYGTSG